MGVGGWGWAGQGGGWGWTGGQWQEAGGGGAAARQAGTLAAAPFQLYGSDAWPRPMQLLACFSTRSAQHPAHHASEADQALVGEQVHCRLGQHRHLHGIDQGHAGPPGDLQGLPPSRPSLSNVPCDQRRRPQTLPAHRSCPSHREISGHRAPSQPPQELRWGPAEPCR